MNKTLKRTLYFIVVIICLLSYYTAVAVEDKEVYKSERLTIRQISELVYQHISYLETKDFGKTSCNGVVITNKNEAVVFDTPVDDGASSELIDWITKSLKSKIIAVIPTHYHVDNLGGLNEFHKQGIPSYAYKKTIQIAKESELPMPQNSFDDFMELKIGNEIVNIDFLGEGHTCDNIIGYFPLEDFMFGGCLIKELGAGKGNLEEANVAEWSETVKKVKKKYPNVKIIIPGHGKVGDIELLDYTIALFE
ncbi:MAG: subclass B1 metallo-beta-lactamase [Firmicutes bacterium]|nr:subclass B1 metallo-beta-lactamase [Bacillota bacterium]